MSTVTIPDIHNAFVERVESCQGFTKVTQTYDSYSNDSAGRPIIYISLLNHSSNNSIDGLPATYTINYELHVRADRGGYPDRNGPQILLPLEQEILKAFKPDVISGFQTLGFARGWVMHVFSSSTEYYYDTIEDDDMVELVMTLSVLAAPEVVSG